MIKSMTGYGRAEFTVVEKRPEVMESLDVDENQEIERRTESFSLELKTLNHRYIDINFKAPEKIMRHEIKARQFIKDHIARGSVGVFVRPTLKDQSFGALNRVVVDTYLDAEHELRQHFALKGELDVSSMLRLKDVIGSSSQFVTDPADDWSSLQNALECALSELDAMRGAEGEALRLDVVERVKVIEGYLGSISKRAPEVLKEYREKLAGELKEFIASGVDEARLAGEVALFSDKMNVNEEVVRFLSHTKQFRTYLSFSEPVGRRLDFLCQEMFREINTIGSKGNDTRVSKEVISFKAGLETIREQVQNIE